MKPSQFDYADPVSLDDALDLLATHGDDATLIAGGQSLIPLLNLRLARPEIVIDLRRVASLCRIEPSDAELRVGSMVRAVDLEEHPAVVSVPGLAAALAFVGHSQIRARTTVGGSIAHADPAAELPALLLALDGSVTLQSRDGGERTVAADAFFDGPLMTTRAPNEVLTEVTFPIHPGTMAIDEVATRPGDFAIVGAISGYDATSGVVASPRIALFGVAGTPIRMPEAEAVLGGAPPDDEVFAAAAQRVRETLIPNGDIHGSSEYRRHLAGVLVERTLRQQHER